jgi:hypothetical protein
VGQFLGADVCQESLGAGGGHGVPLGEVADPGGKLAVRTAVLPVLQCVKI